MDIQDHVRNYYVLLHYLLISVNEVLMNFFDDDVTARRESKEPSRRGVWCVGCVWCDYKAVLM